jgi:hypothetical protein
MVPAYGVGVRALGGTLAALRIALVGLAAMCGALIAHVVIDIVGDYVLARDAYDGVSHESRLILIVGVVSLMLAVAVRLVLDLLDRRCGSRASLLRLVRDSLGQPLPFIVQSIAVGVVAVGAMELFDCLIAHAIPHGLNELFGGSYLLGLSAVSATTALSGWLVHRVATRLSEREPEITALIRWLVALIPAAVDDVRVATGVRTLRSIARALLLSTRGSKRGPPLPTPA